MKLSFYDHHRQTYGHMPIDTAAEFMIGDYGEPGEDCGVGQGGEFKLTLIELSSGARSFGRTETRLHPHLEVFGDATGSLRAAIAAGLLESMETVQHRDELARRLMSIGIPDRSAYPIGSGDPLCPCCKQPVPERSRS